MILVQPQVPRFVHLVDRPDFREPNIGADDVLFRCACLVQQRVDLPKHAEGLFLDVAGAVLLRDNALRKTKSPAWTIRLKRSVKSCLSIVMVYFPVLRSMSGD